MTFGSELALLPAAAAPQRSSAPVALAAAAAMASFAGQDRETPTKDMMKRRNRAQSLASIAAYLEPRSPRLSLDDPRVTGDSDSLGDGPRPMQLPRLA